MASYSLRPPQSSLPRSRTCAFVFGLDFAVRCRAWPAEAGSHMVGTLWRCAAIRCLEDSLTKCWSHIRRYHVSLGGRLGFRLPLPVLSSGLSAGCRLRIGCETPRLMLSRMSGNMFKGCWRLSLWKRGRVSWKVFEWRGGEGGGGRDLDAAWMSWSRAAEGVYFKPTPEAGGPLLGEWFLCAGRDQV